MKYLIISLTVAGMTLLINPHAKTTEKALYRPGTLQNNSQHSICMANISAGILCSETAQAQQKLVMVRGQPLPL